MPCHGVVSSIEEIAKGEEIAFGLRHLFPFDQQMLSMNPEADERMPCRGLALSDLVFVMRENIVNASAVNIEHFAQMLHGHRGALEMPPRTTGAKRRVPPRLPLVFRSLP